MNTAHALNPRTSHTAALVLPTAALTGILALTWLMGFAPGIESLEILPLLGLLGLLMVGVIFNTVAQLRDMGASTLPALPGLTLMVGALVCWHASLAFATSHDVFWFCAIAALSGLVSVSLALLQLARRKPLAIDVEQQAAPQFAAPAPQTQRAAAPAPAQQDAQPEQPDPIVYSATRGKLTLADIVGQDEMKDEVRKALAAWRKQEGNGIVLFGPPGGGKTMMAKAIAGELNAGIIKVGYGDLASKWVGESTENMRKLFQDAWAQAPVVLFLDEADSLLASRGSNNSFEEYNRMVTTFLALVDDTREMHPGVLLVAATNFKDNLDQAAVRASRFDFPIEVKLPDAVARRHLIDTELQKARMRMEPDVLARLVERWGGLNVPTIQKAMQRAAEIADSAKTNTIGLAHLIKALRTLQGYKGGAAENAKSIDELFYAPDVKRRLNTLAMQLSDLERFEAMGGVLPKGVLFVGPPGTGKTAAAGALAKACNWPLLVYSGKDLMSTDAVAKLREKAGGMRPAIVFIDEADDILVDRRMSAHKQETNEVLQLIDGAGGMLHDIVWIAATNNAQVMDDAAVRGGRFGLRVTIDLPDETVLRQVVAHWAQDNKAFLGSVDQDAWIDSATSALVGLSQASTMEALKDAKNLAVMDAMEAAAAESKSATVLLEHVQSARASMASEQI
jgi:transitional endoplasmic reticulum ATPase